MDEPPEDVETRLQLKNIIPSILFMAAAAGWVGLILSGSGVLLFWPALASILSAAATIVWPSRRITEPLAGASAIFGLILSLYQLYIAVSLSYSPLGGLATYSIILFSGFTVLYLALLPLSLRSRKKEAEEVA